MAKRKRRGVGIVALLVLVAATVAGVVYVPGWLDQYGDRVFSQSRCTVTLGTDSNTLTAEQADNAALITAMSIRLGLPARAATIAIATAIQESSLRNIDFGDRDSLGLFQQRPSQGWGTPEEIMDPYYSTLQFYEHLVRIDGWRDMPVTEAAQAVQRSAFPEAYADHEPEARLWASALTGHGGEVNCTLTEPRLGSVAVYERRLRDDFGDSAALTVSYSPEDVDTALVVAEDSTAQSALMNWSVATAIETQAVRIEGCGNAWNRGRGEWQTIDIDECSRDTFSARINAD